MAKKFSIKTDKIDASFDNLPSSSYWLSMCLNADSLQYSVFEPLKQKFVAFGNAYFYPEKIGTSSYNELFSEFLNENPILQKPFDRKILVYETQCSTLIPEALYDKKELHSYLNFNQNVDTHTVVFSDRLINACAYNVFGLPDIVTENNQFGQLSRCHHASVLIEAALITFKNKLKGKLVLVNVHYGFFDMLIIEDNKLVFYNSFAYKTPEDFIYFVMFVYEQLKLNPEETGVMLTGEIVKDSTLFQMLYKYIRFVDFIPVSASVQNSYILQDIEAHRYFILLHSAICGL